MRFSKFFKYLFIGLVLVTAALVGYAAYWSSVSKGCAQNQSDQSFMKQIFEKKGTGIYLGMIKEGLWMNPFMAKGWVAQYEGFSCNNMPTALAVINDPAYDDGEKIEAALLMQNLPPADYYEFSRTALNLFKQGKLSKQVLDFVFMPWLDLTSTSQQWVYWHPTWRALLKAAKAAVNEQHFSHQAEEKLSGQTFWRWFDLYLDAKARQKELDRKNPKQ